MLQGIKLENDDGWSVKVICPMHNHPSAERLEGHSFAGRLTKKEESLVIDLTENMVKAKNILSTLKNKDEKNVTTIKTIYNVRNRLRLREKAGRSQMQQLMKKLNDCNYVEWHRRNEETDSMKDLFWGRPTCI